MELDLKLGSNATVSACGVRGVDASTEAGLQVDQKHGFGSRSEFQFVCIGFDPYYLTWLSPIILTVPKNADRQVAGKTGRCKVFCTICSPVYVLHILVSSCWNVLYVT